MNPMHLCLCICICTCERPAGLALLLKAIDRQRLGDLAESTLRILVVDNGRSDVDTRLRAVARGLTSDARVPAG